MNTIQKFNFPSFCCEIVEKSKSSEISYEYLSIFEYDFCLCSDEDSGEKKYKLYFKSKEEAEKASENLKRLPREWQEAGIEFGESKIFFIEQKDWSEEWKKFFPIQHIAENLTVRPAWLKYTPQKEEEAVVVVDPGMSFGTGGHATTRFCLKMLAELPGKRDKTFFDAGCGSGILSAAAYKLGYKSIAAFDYDPVCIKCSLENFEMNHIPEGSVDLFKADIMAFPDDKFKQYDVTVVNILAHIILKSVETITTFVSTGGYLILAGILTSEYAHLREEFIASGFTELISETESEWTGGFFRRL